MRLYNKLRTLEKLTGIKEGVYNINYEYDEKQRIVKEVLTGDITKTTQYLYDENDNIIEERISEDNKIIKKNYLYDANGNIQQIQVTIE